MMIYFDEYQYGPDGDYIPTDDELAELYEDEEDPVSL